MLLEDDMIVVGAETIDEKAHINLKELVIKKENPWAGVRIRDLDISRHSIIVMVKRRNKTLIPNGNMLIKPEDVVLMYTQLHLSDAKDIEV